MGQGGQLGAARGGVRAWPSSRPISAERPGGGGAEPGLEPPPAPPPPSTGGGVAALGGAGGGGARAAPAGPGSVLRLERARDGHRRAGLWALREAPGPGGAAGAGGGAAGTPGAAAAGAGPPRPTGERDTPTWGRGWCCCGWGGAAPPNR
ncbi:translation initiation factor IF-2-like [Melozone crissalis]|uniref:translation initiation factor IF-2-like n=1 Tax=Melozone crissalis TaxID=40204 RepID=UPI0023DB098A|nr:translation initiation factor IF-2-like [Melozone crissalis]